MPEQILDKKAYDRDQLEQLKLGREHGVDISMFSNPDYMALQMEWIRKGLEDGIDVSLYASPSYDWFQMEEIYKGIVDSVDVSKYCRPDIPYDRMREIRKGLAQGIDLSPFVKYGHKELRQLRHALKNKVHIVKYMTEGYDDEQLEVIWKALAEGVNIDPYLKVEYRGVALNEIVLGLKKKLNVDSYANINYSWQQMREIREGLEERLDVDMYKSYLYNASQMHEIRLGLEAGLDVSEYRSLMYTPRDMRKRRLKIVEELTGGSSIPMIPGDDGYHEFLFDDKADGSIIINEDGSVDFTNSFKLERCKERDIIAIYHAATEGKNGLSATGKVIKATKGREGRVLSGKGVSYNENYKAYMALSAGWIHLDEEDDLIEVKPAVILDSINGSMGHLVMHDSVEVLGNIITGASLEVYGDLIVDGHVEEAQIKCSGHIIIRGGINGNGIANLQAGKSIISLYIENSTLKAGGDIRAEYILSSSVHSDKEVIVLGPKGSIIGSNITAVKGITCKNAGNEAMILTKLTIKRSEQNDQYEEILSGKIAGINRELKILEMAKEKYKNRYSAEERNNKAEFIKLENAIYTKKLELEDTEKNYKELLAKNKEARRAKIQVLEKTYDGVVFKIDKHKYEASREKGKLIVDEIGEKIRIQRD